MDAFPMRKINPQLQVVLTVIVVSRQVFGVNVQVMVSVQFPKLAVDDVEVLVGEVVSDLVDVVLLLQQSQRL